MSECQVHLYYTLDDTMQKVWLACGLQKTSVCGQPVYGVWKMNHPDARPVEACKEHYDDLEADRESMEKVFGVVHGATGREDA
jgi:hypothetical protein